MINVQRARADLNRVPGDVVVFTRAQVAEMLDAVEIGQTARRSLTELKTAVSIAASVSGAPPRRRRGKAA